jgi:hypothetical protein
VVDREGDDLESAVAVEVADGRRSRGEAALECGIETTSVDAWPAEGQTA